MCLYPRLVWYDGERIAWVPPKEDNLGGGVYLSKWKQIRIKCGKCVECLKARADEWTVRIMDELKQHNEAIMLTLTYRNNPESLIKRDLQLFVKRLRKYLEPRKIRYFACGEYGDKGGRPHFHICIFGWRPSDLERFFYNDGWIYKSEICERIWQHGFVTAVEVTPATARYVVNYMQKLDGRPHEVKPFVCMSTRPGIGYNVIEDLMYSIYKTGKVYVSGMERNAPRYYMKVLERDGLFLDHIVEQRIRVGKLKERDWKELHELAKIKKRQLGASTSPAVPKDNQRKRRRRPRV